MAAAVLLAGLFCLLLPERSARSGELSQDTIKAGFLYNFAQYASWLNGSVNAGMVTLCLENGVLDDGVFAGWDTATAGERRVKLVRVERTVARLGKCDLLFTGTPNAAETMPDLLAAARREHMLLVSDAAGFARAGGHIELFLDNKQFRFRINLDELKRSGVVLSSKVLRLAEIVDGKAWRTVP